MSAFREVFTNMNYQSLIDLLIPVGAALICITLHELAHGLAAYYLGDQTAKERGRLSLNPLRHIDPIGLLMLAIFKLGWAKPVPVDMRQFKNPKAGMALTALAGPAMNVLISIVALLLFRLFPLTFFLQIALMSLGLGLFNLLPIPPLDGSKILFSFLPDRAYLWLMRYERYGMFLLIAIIWLGSFTGKEILPLGKVIYTVFYWMASWLI